VDLSEHVDILQLPPEYIHGYNGGILLALQQKHRRRAWRDVVLFLAVDRGVPLTGLRVAHEFVFGELEGWQQLYAELFGDRRQTPELSWVGDH